MSKRSAKVGRYALLVLLPGGLVVLAAWLFFNDALRDLWIMTKSQFQGTAAMRQTRDSLNLSRLDEATARQYASDAGFAGPGLDTIVAIAHAESALDPRAINDNKNKSGVVTSTDRGIIQINTHYHPEVSDEEAFNPVTAFQHGFRISGGGMDFTPWSTYKNGAYQKFLPTPADGSEVA